MGRVLDMFNRQKNAYINADGRNPEGFASFKRSLEEAYLQVLLTNTLGGTFYASSQELFEGSLALHQEMAEHDPGFMARALVYARILGLMRLQPIVGLVFLSRADSDLFRRAFRAVINTPGDLADFVEIARGGVVRAGLGRALKAVVNSYLNGLSEYHAIKYGQGGKGYRLGDIIRLTHPQPLNARQEAIFIWLLDRDKWLGSADLRALTPQIDAFERLKRLDVSAGQDGARALIAEGRLPYEVVTGVVQPDAETWHTLMEQMPYLALLRHLNTFQRAGVLRDEAGAGYVARRLTNREALAKARVLPFRLFTAYQMFDAENGAEKQVTDALSKALEASFANMPDLGARVCIAPDVSGSMSGSIGGRGRTRYSDISGIFSGALLKASQRALVLPFEDKVLSVKLNPRDSLMTLASQVARLGGGGTAVSAPVSYLLDRKTPVDTFIGITDNIEWATDQSGRLGFLPTWREYRRKIAPQAQAFLITIAPYRHAVVPQDEPGVHYIYGWNEQVLSYISLAARNVTGQVDVVRGMEV